MVTWYFLAVHGTFKVLELIRRSSTFRNFFISTSIMENSCMTIFYINLCIYNACLSNQFEIWISTNTIFEWFKFFKIVSLKCTVFFCWMYYLSVSVWMNYYIILFFFFLGIFALMANCEKHVSLGICYNLYEHLESLTICVLNRLNCCISSSNDRWFVSGLLFGALTLTYASHLLFTTVCVPRYIIYNNFISVLMPYDCSVAYANWQ